MNSAHDTAGRGTNSPTGCSVSPVGSDELDDAPEHARQGTDSRQHRPLTLVRVPRGLFLVHAWHVPSHQ